MFFSSHRNTFVTFVCFYIRVFGKKLEKSCLTERLKCEQKYAKNRLCAICIVGDMGDMKPETAKFQESGGNILPG